MKKLLYIMMAVILTCGVFDTTSMATPKPQYGGVLKIIHEVAVRNIGVPGLPTSHMDPLVAKPAIESLFSLDESGSEKTVPQLATGWKYAPDHSYVTISLRKGVKFHDGTDFNAEAAKFNLELTRKSRRPELKDVTSIDILDDYTIKLNLSSYNPLFINSLNGYPAWMVSPTAFKKMGEDKAKYHPVGTGPFKIVSCQRDSLIKYEKFDGYWQEGKPYLDGIEYIIIVDGVTRMASFKAKEGHTVTATATDAYTFMNTGKFNTNQFFTHIVGIAGDSANPDSIFSDIRVRRAIAYAIDTPSIAKALGFGFYLSSNQLRLPGTFGYNPNVTGYPYNPEKAKELLAQAGYPNGFTTKLTFETEYPYRDIFSAVQQYLSKVGIRITLDEAEGARYNDQVSKGWNDQLIQFVGVCTKGFDPTRLFDGRLSLRSHRVDPKSLARSEEYDTLLEDTLIESDEEKRLEMLYKLQKLVIDDYCMVIPLIAPGRVSISYPELHDYTAYTYAGSMDWSPWNAWLSK